MRASRSLRLCEQERGIPSDDFCNFELALFADEWTEWERVMFVYRIDFRNTSWASTLANDARSVRETTREL